MNEDKYIQEVRELTDLTNQLAKKCGLAKKDGNEDYAKYKIEYTELVEQKRELIKQYNREKDLDILTRCIEKEDLIDGAWYETDFDGKKLARFTGKAQWLKDRNEFLAPGQQQFGMDGYLDYFGDVIDINMAGFAPMKKA